MTDNKAMVVEGYYEDHAMSVEKLTGQMRIIKNVMEKIMLEGEHYGTIPGCGPKRTLHKSGAEKLCVTFRLAPSYDIRKTNLRDDHREYEIVTTLIHIPTGNVIAQGVGSCSTLESKYRYRNEALKCPTCGKEETIIKGRDEYGGGWLCFGRKGGCGAKFKDGDPAIEKQPRGRVEHTDPADHYNTVLKMAKKRSLTDAILTATAASDVFISDGDGGDPEPPGADGVPSLDDYERLIKIGANRKEPLSRSEINKIANWYRKGDKLTKSELEKMISDFDIILNAYLDQTSKEKKS